MDRLDLLKDFIDNGDHIIDELIDEDQCIDWPINAILEKYKVWYIYAVKSREVGIIEINFCDRFSGQEFGEGPLRYELLGVFEYDEKNGWVQRKYRIVNRIELI